MFIRFSHPQYLLLLPLVWAYTWWVMRDTLADLGRSRGRWAAGMRLFLLTLIVLALSGIQFVRPTTSLCTIFVVDISDSVEHTPAARQEIYNYINVAAKKMRTGDALALVAFGAEALLDHAPEDSRHFISKIFSIPSSSRTDIAAGIQLAMASFPQESGKQIVLFSDGNENLGDALEQAGLAISSDVRISVKPLARDTARGEVLVRQVALPQTVKQGAPFQVAVVAETMLPTHANVLLYRDGTLVAQRAVNLPAGATMLTFEQTAPSGGTYQYRAVLQAPPEKDTVPDNNAAYAFTRVQGTPKVLLIENAAGDGASLAATLRAHQVTTVEGGPDRIPTSLADCAQYDSIIFANVPAWRMTTTQMAVIRAAVQDTGMGFLMIGGDESFGAGGYYNTPIEEALPVTMEAKKQETYSSVAIALVLEDLEIQTLTDISIEGAKAFVDMLGPADYVGVIDQMSQWRIPMRRVDSRGSIKSQMDQLKGLGDTDMYGPPMLEAAKQLQTTRARVKHIVLIGDGDGMCEPATLQKIRSMGITVSAISTGIDGDYGFKTMQNIARLGGGQAYETKRPQDLPRHLARDTNTISRPPIVEKDFRPVIQYSTSAILNGVDWSSAPTLRGYVVAGVREKTPLAQLLMTSPKNDPILAAWQYGLGHTVAFTSDACGRWGTNWLHWSGYASFWPQAVRWTLRQRAPVDFQTSVSEDHGRASVTVDAVAQNGEFRNLLDLRAHIAFVAPGGYDPETTDEVVPLEQTAPGRYETSFETKKVGAYVLTVEERDGDKTTGLQTNTLVIPYSPEFQHIAPNAALLEQVASRAKGEVKPPPEDIYGRLRFGSRTLRDIWTLVLCLAALLFLFDVALRRILIPWSEMFAAVRKAIKERFPTPAPAPAAAGARGTVVSPLLNVKGKVKRPGFDESASTAARLRQAREQAHETQTPTTLAAPPIPDAPPAPPVADAPATTAGRLLRKKRERDGK